MSSPTQLQVLLLAFKDMNILDLTGPCEVFAHAKAKLTVGASSEITTSFEGISVQRDRSLASLLDSQDTMSDDTSTLPPLEQYDVLVIPGSLFERVLAAIEHDADICNVIAKWANLARPPVTASTGNWKNRKPLLTICGGASFAGYLGLLGGKPCTTHYLDLEGLQAVCVRAGQKADVVRKRVVDAGETSAGMRVLTSGGVSCGIDASLWLVGQMVGLDEAKSAARLMDYKWEVDLDGDITKGMLV
ncbi:hypothetical protein CB0940_03652 [Cercospora beticola]|uniref:DJ-1/PfpI domain-containing protein n=1 Tax=Cercospora beticola TaxID=122368 RepID=A0A2G5I5B7_CERBT|nr:hypothetical protein CB0940_03652 [Cercospora beticola]PIA99999.1 hypothetical protein CB0940_03652 [Cercospora beticola]WPB00832.1 hypothetical protein RHO25_005452 [Cercospora beticola]CAK1360927.1 unnamed protein product [Cercospora beticola]